MPYITSAAFAAAFDQAELDELTASEADAFERAAKDASSLVDGYLAVRVTLPLVSVPDVVVRWTLDIARFMLWDQKAPEEVRTRYEDTLAQLRDLAAGRFALPPGATGATPAAALRVDGYSSPRVFTDAGLAGFMGCTPR